METTTEKVIRITDENNYPIQVNDYIAYLTTDNFGVGKVVGIVNDTDVEVLVWNEDSKTETITVEDDVDTRMLIISTTERNLQIIIDLGLASNTMRDTVSKSKQRDIIPLFEVVK